MNCIDCLDRTNVVQVSDSYLQRCIGSDNALPQSAFARYVLNKQFGAVALLNPELDGLTDADLVFNDGKLINDTHDIKLMDVYSTKVWANNGDAISRA